MFGWMKLFEPTWHSNESSWIVIATMAADGMCCIVAAVDLPASFR
jgi:hypothetical protein